MPSPWVTNSFTYYFRYLCYYLFWDILLISNALSGNQYKSIIAFDLNDSLKSSPWVLPEERYLGEIAKRIAKHRHIEFLRIPLIGKKKNNKVHLASLRKIIKNDTVNLIKSSKMSPCARVSWTAMTCTMCLDGIATACRLNSR